ncbi:MAG: hypothetical protein KAQ99_09825 [Candidatus Aureabacteria bacterium]|nr:hypothetical protein [Candidatus Auribacterota bacterium]
MVSDELLEFWAFVAGILVCIVAIALFLYFIDRARREGPFHFLGYAIAGAWSWQAGQAIMEGEIGGVPMSPTQIQKLARDQIKAKRDQKSIDTRELEISKAQLEQRIAQLKKEKEELEADTKQVISP